MSGQSEACSKFRQSGSSSRTVDLKEVSPPTLHLAALGLGPAAHLKGLKSQCRDRYSIE